MRELEIGNVSLFLCVASEVQLRAADHYIGHVQMIAFSRYRDMHLEMCSYETSNSGSNHSNAVGQLWLS